MAGRWIDEDQGGWRPRDDEPFYYGRDSYGRGRRDREERSWERERPDTYAARRQGPGRDRVFGERETGMNYGRAGGPASGYQRDNQQRSPNFRSQDYTQGGRFYGDDSRERIYREEYGQGGVEYGDEPRGYDADRDYSATRARSHARGYGEPGYGDWPEPARRQASGGTGGYDYERGYGDGGRSSTGSSSRSARRWEDAGREAGDFFHRAGERMASWFGGGGEARAAYPDYGRTDYDRPERGHRGRGPQGYKRPDERISDDAHERLTDDSWLDASNIAVSVANGEVTLSGTVENREAKHRAEHIVEDIPGVTHVQNNLRAKTGYSAGSSESVLGAQIRAEGPPENKDSSPPSAGGGKKN